VIEAKADEQLREHLLKKHEFYILKCASKSCHRFITKSDDEWSVAFMAFSQAIDHYDLSKGSFMKFAELVIKRRMIDFVKSQAKYNSETSVDPIIFDAEPDETTEDLSIRMAVADKVSREEQSDLKLEINTVNQIFQVYGFTFMDLSDSSPRTEKTKRACAKAIKYMLSNPSLIKELQLTRQLPLKIIENGTEIPRKILERHRKYIIAATEILSGDYPYLAEYLRYIREESK